MQPVRFCLSIDPIERSSLLHLVIQADMSTMCRRGFADGEEERRVAQRRGHSISAVA